MPAGVVGGTDTKLSEGYLRERLRAELPINPGTVKLGHTGQEAFKTGVKGGGEQRPGPKIPDAASGPTHEQGVCLSTQMWLVR